MPAKLRPDQVHRTIAVVVDDLNLSYRSVMDIRPALTKFVREQIQSGDLVAIVRTAGDVGILQQFTSDKRKLLAAAEAVRWHWQSSTGLDPTNPTTTGTAYADSAGAGAETTRRLTFLANGMRTLPGRKSIVMFTEGDLFQPGADVNPLLSSFQTFMPERPEVFPLFEKLLDMTSRAAAPIYTIDARGLPNLSLSSSVRIMSPQLADASQQPTDSMGQTVRAAQEARMRQVRDSQESMQYLANKTGGLFLHDVSNDLSLPLRRAVDDQQGYYLLGYTPAASTFEGPKGALRFHKIGVKVRRPGASVHTQSGFFGEQDQAPPPKGSNDAMLASLVSPFGSAEIEVGMTSLFFDSSEKGPFIATLVNAKAAGLTFREEAGGRAAQGDIAVMLFGENGQVADKTALTFNARLRGADYDRAMKNGFLFTFHMPVKKAGPYEVRVAVRDKAAGTVGTASTFLEVPDLKPDALAVSGIMLETPLPAGQTAEPGQDVRGGTALRIFHPGETITYGYQVLNPKLDAATHQPMVRTQVKLYRDGKEFFTENPAAVPVGPDVKRLLAGGNLKIGRNVPPGEYVLQATVTDLVTGPKLRSVTQWIDFRVMP